MPEVLRRRITLNPTWLVEFGVQLIETWVGASDFALRSTGGLIGILSVLTVMTLVPTEYPLTL